MTKSIRPVATLTDIHGNPFYLDLRPCIDEKADTKLNAAWIDIVINGHAEKISAREAHSAGMMLIGTAARVTAAPLPRGIKAGLLFSVGDTPRVEIDPGLAGEIGVNLIGAACTAMHDHVVYTYLTGTLGYTKARAVEFFENMPVIEPADYLAYPEEAPSQTGAAPVPPASESAS